MHTYKWRRLHTDASVFLSVCSLLLTVCKSTCPSDDWFECITPDDHVYCYYVTPDAHPSSQQKQACADLHEEADFAILNSEQTNEVCVISNIAAIGVPTEDPGVWIGLNKYGETWKWLDGVQEPNSDYSRNFYNGASGNCATLRQNPYSLLWFWYSKECLIDAQALCYVNISSVATTTEEPTTTQEVTTTQEMTSTQQLTTTEEVITTIPTTQETTTSHTSDVTITGIEATTGELVLCEDLPFAPNTLASSVSAVAGSLVTINCLTGYTNSDFTQTRGNYCDEDGKWTSETPKCEVQVTCPRDNDVIGLHKPLPHSTEVTISCPADQIFNTGETQHVTECSAQGVWSHQETGVVCISTSESCGPVPYVENADVVSGDDQLIASLVISCHVGHRFPNGKVTAQLQCEQDKVWTWTNNLDSWECLVITCPAVQSVHQATANTNLAIFGTLVTLECTPGYEYPDKTTQKNTQCLDSGSWSDVIPDCEQIHCTIPPVVEGGTTADSGTEAFTILTFTCNPGTRFWDGTEVKNVTCEVTGNWSDTYLNCTDDRCPPLPEVLNSDLSSRLASKGIVAVYSCHSGYYLPSGASRVTTQCTDLLQWSVIVPEQCSAVDCGPPPDLEQSEVTFTSTQLHAISNYTCVVGHVWTESTGIVLDNDTMVSECSTNGNWTQFSTTCLPVDCGEPLDLGNATKSFTSTTYLSELTYQCIDAHWIRRGETIQTVTCTSNGVWCCEQPCVEVTCPPVPTWANTEFSTTVKSVGTWVNYTCEEGYFMQETHKSSECLPTGEWQPDIPECLEEDTSPTVIEPTEAPRSVSIGATAATCIGVVFGIIALLDIMSYGKRGSIITHRFKGMRRKIKAKTKQMKIGKMTMRERQRSQEVTGKTSPRDITPLLVTDYDGQVDWDLQKMKEDIGHSERLNRRRGTQVYEVDTGDSMAGNTNGQPPMGFYSKTWTKKKKKQPRKGHKVKKRKDSCDFIDLEPLSSR